mmetsp:Transcript_48769/g.128615  ORF Transcript_48769/g.128615 Transcript_48769/m.128615 type:complete len:583 (+) Transcript_48769:826-2574(+)
MLRAALARMAGEPAHAAGIVHLRSLVLLEEAEPPAHAQPPLFLLSRLLLEPLRQAVQKHLDEPLREEDRVRVRLHHPIVVQVPTLLDDLAPDLIEDPGVQGGVPLAAVRNGEREVHQIDTHWRRLPRVEQLGGVAEDHVVVACEQTDAPLLLRSQEIGLVAKGKHQGDAIQGRPRRLNHGDMRCCGGFEGSSLRAHQVVHHDVVRRAVREPHPSLLGGGARARAVREADDRDRRVVLELSGVLELARLLENELIADVDVLPGHLHQPRAALAVALLLLRRLLRCLRLLPLLLRVLLLLLLHDPLPLLRHRPLDELSGAGFLELELLLTGLCLHQLRCHLPLLVLGCLELLVGPSQVPAHGAEPCADVLQLEELLPLLPLLGLCLLNQDLPLLGLISVTDLFGLRLDLLGQRLLFHGLLQGPLLELLGLRGPLREGGLVHQGLQPGPLRAAGQHGLERLREAHVVVVLLRRLELRARRALAGGLHQVRDLLAVLVHEVLGRTDLLQGGSMLLLLLFLHHSFVLERVVLGLPMLLGIDHLTGRLHVLALRLQAPESDAVYHDDASRILDYAQRVLLVESDLRCR